MSQPVTYFAVFPNSGLLKVGSSVNPYSRLRTLISQKIVKAPFVILGTSKKLTEAKAHELFAKWQVKGEWYRPTLAAKRLATSLADKNWNRSLLTQYNVRFTQQQRKGLRKRFPAKSDAASMRKLVDAILDGRIVSKRKTAKA